jgi:release factor glutamine methyltransferase
VAADEEAAELTMVARDSDELMQMVTRRLTGEPLAWITGRTTFCGLEVAVGPGVYVPRWQSEPLATAAAERLPERGTGVDLGTGCGAVALVLRSVRPESRVVATEVDPVAATCARANGLDVHLGDLDLPLPLDLRSQVDVMVGVLPYVPAGAFHLLPRDVRRFEPRAALDGGPGGLELVERAVRAGPGWLRPGGWLLLEVGSDQIPASTALFAGCGYRDIEVVEDGDGDQRGLCGRHPA